MLDDAKYATSEDRDQALHQWVRQIDAGLPERAARCALPACRRAHWCRGWLPFDAPRPHCRMLTVEEDLARHTDLMKSLRRRWATLQAEGDPVAQ
jgi:hypothetical protein